ncbi:MAG: TlpA family protein disulfide reductase [Deltaproteobacteria bacterium]|nr:TlpA family protein disulfide reductase [Deltaproteobacteria bacterium]
MTSQKIKSSFFVLFIVALTLFIAGNYIISRKNEELMRASFFFPVYLNSYIPVISLADAQGRVVTENDLKNGVYILHFWATWCRSCEQELFGISKIQNKNLRIMCISVDEEPSNAVKFLEERNLNLPLFFDKEGKAAKAFGTLKYPETYIVRDGQVIIKFEGPRDWGDENLIEFILNTAGLIRDYNR